MKVRRNRQKVAATRIHRNGLVSPLEQVTPFPVFGIESLGVRSLQPLHAYRQIGLRRLHQQMVVIPHQNIRVDIPSRPLANLPQRGKEKPPIPFRLENRLPPVPAIHHMVNRARILQPGFPRHASFSHSTLRSVKKD